MNTDGHPIRRTRNLLPGLARRLRALSCRPLSSNTISRVVSRMTAVFTAACFLFTSVIGPAAYALPEVRVTVPRSSTEQFVLPASLGRITDANYAGSKRVVIVIQDLHCHPEVQKNICAILSRFDAAFGLRRVFSEGAVGQVDTAWAGSIAEPALRRKAVESLVESGKLTGAEYYAIRSGKPALVSGLEDEALYTGNLVRLSELMSRRQELQGALPGIRERLAALKERYYGPRMLRLERLAAENRSGNLPADRYYRALVAGADRRTVDLHDYPNLKEYLAVTQLQKRLNGKNAGRQLARLLSDLKQELPYTDYRTIADAAGDPSRRDELSLRLPRLLADRHIRIDTAYPELARSLDLAERTRRLNPAALLREERALERELRGAIARSGAEREIAFIAGFEVLLEEYLYNRITAEDHAYFAANRERFERYWKKYTGGGALDGLKPYAALCDEFYRVNLERNRSFLRAVLGEAPLPARPVRLVPAADQSPQVLDSLKDAEEIETVVTGGFHTDGLTGLLRDRNISYLVVMPNVTGGTARAQSVYDGLAREQGKMLSQTLQILIGWQGLDHAAGPQAYAQVAAQNIDGNFIDRMTAAGLGRAEIQKTVAEMLAGVRKQHGKASIPEDVSFRFVEFGEDGKYVCDIILGEDPFRYTTRTNEVSFEPAPAPRAHEPRAARNGSSFFKSLLHRDAAAEDPGAAPGADGLVASLGDPAATEKLNEALQIVYDRKFFTEGQLKELLPKLRFKATSDKNILVDLQPHDDGTWTIAINRVMLEKYPYLSPKTHNILRLKLAYLVARKMDSLSFGAFADARYLGANLAERKAVVYLRDTGRVKQHPEDTALLLEFPSLLSGLNMGKKGGRVSPAIMRYEQEYAGLLRHVLDGRFYGFTFVGEPEWLRMVGNFIAANREYYRHQWWSGITLFIDHFLVFAQNLDHRNILRYLRWYENQLDYWQEGGTHVNTDERKLFEDDFPSGPGTPVPFKYNFYDRVSDAVYSGGVVERILLEKVPGEQNLSLVEETIRKIHGEKISLADIKGVYVRELGEGSLKRAYYVAVVTPKGCFEFVLLMAAYHNKLEDFIGNITLPGEEEALAWGGAQFADKTPAWGARIPPGMTFGIRHRGALTVSYMGHNLKDLVSESNGKLTNEGKRYLLKRAVTTYFESLFRFGGTTIVDDMKPDNVASLDTQVDIVDFGKQREGELVYDTALYLKTFWKEDDWDFSYLTVDRSYIFDAFMDVFAGSPYGTAAGANLLRQSLADPYEVKLPADLQSALAAYLKTGVVKYLREPGNAEAASPLGEPDWKHIDETYRSLSPDKKIVFNKGYAPEQVKDAYWFLGRALGIAQDTGVDALSDEQVQRTLARFRQESLAVPGLQVLQLVKIWAERYRVTVDAIRNAETYQALLRTLSEQVAQKANGRPVREASVAVTDADRAIVAGLTGFQVRSVLDELVNAGAQPDASVHIDFRKAEILIALLSDGEHPEWEKRCAAARKAFMAMGKERSVGRDERDAAAILDSAVSENYTRLIIEDPELAQRVAGLAQEQCLVIDIQSSGILPPPGDARGTTGSSIAAFLSRLFSRDVGKSIPGVAVDEDRLVPFLGDPVYTERLNEALQVIYDRNFFTEGQLKELLPKLRFTVTDDRNVLVDIRPRPDGTWTIAINRAMLRDTRYLSPRASEILKLKLGYLITRKIDGIAFFDFANERYLDHNVAERKAIVYLRDTGRVKQHPEDAALLLEFPSLMEEMRLTGKRAGVSPAIDRYEREYAALLRHVLDGKFYGFTFVGEPEWLKLVGEFIVDNRDYYSHQWWSGITLIDRFLSFAQNLDHRDVLRYLRWYENYLDYWQEGGVYVNTDSRKLVEKEFSPDVPFKFNYRYTKGQSPGSFYSWLSIKRMLLEKVPGTKDATLIEETVRKIHGTEISLDDIKGIYVRDLSYGQMKWGFYVIAVTPKGCFEFVLLLAAYDKSNEDEDRFVKELTVNGEEEALAWGGAQFADKTPVLGVRLPPNQAYDESKAGALTVSYMGHSLRDLIREQNWKLTEEGKRYLIRRAMATYFENVFRFGGTMTIGDIHTDNIASLDTNLGIIDFGLPCEGDLVIDITNCLWSFTIVDRNAKDEKRKYWQLDYLPISKEFIFDTFMDIFAGSPYAEAVGADLLRQAMSNPYHNDTMTEDMQSALAVYLKTGVIKYFTKPAKTQMPHPLGEPNWEHINGVFRSLSPDTKIIFNKTVIEDQKRDSYWFMGQSLGFAPDTPVDVLSDGQVLQLLARFRRETLAFPGLRVLQLLRIWVKRYGVAVDSIRDAETYQALLRTLSEQALLKARGNSLQEVSVAVTAADRETMPGLTRYQVEDVLHEFAVSEARSGENVHVDLRKAEVVISLLGRARGGEYPELEGQYVAARAAFVARGGEMTVNPDENDPAAVLEAAITNNCTRLVIADPELARRVAERARAQYAVIDIRMAGPLPGDIRKETGKLAAILRAVQPGRWVRLAGRQLIIAVRVPLKIVGQGLSYIDPRFRDLPIRKTVPALLFNGYVTTSEDPAYPGLLAAQGMNVAVVSRREPGVADRKLFRVALPLKDTAGETVLLDVYGRSNATQGGMLCQFSYRFDQTLDDASLKLLPVIAPWYIGMELEKDPVIRRKLGIPLFRFDEYELTADAGSPGEEELTALQKLKDGEPRLRGTVFVYDERPGAPASKRYGTLASAAAGRIFDGIIRTGDQLAKLRLIGALRERKSSSGLLKGDSRISVTYGEDIAALMDEARIARYRESGADTFMLPWNKNLKMARAVRDRLHAAGLRTGSVFAASDAAGLAGMQKDLPSSLALGDASVRLDLRGAAIIDEALMKEILLLAEQVRAVDPESSIEVILPDAMELKEYAAACRTFEAGDIRVVVTASPADILSSPAAALIRKGLLKKPLLEITDTVNGVPCDVSGNGEELQAKLNDLFKQVSDFGISARMMDWYREAYTANPDHLLSLKEYLLGLLKTDPLRLGRGDAASLSGAALRAVDGQTADRILALLRTARAQDAAAAGPSELLVTGFRDTLKDYVPAGTPEPVTEEEKAEYIAYGTAFCTALMERFAEKFIDADRPFVSDKDRRMYVAGIVKGLQLLEGTPLNDISSANDLIAALNRLPAEPLDPGLQENLDRLSQRLSAPLFRETVNRLAAAVPGPRSLAELLRLLALADRDEKGMLEHLKESLDTQILPAATKQIISAA